MYKLMGRYVLLGKFLVLAELLQGVVVIVADVE